MLNVTDILSDIVRERAAAHFDQMYPGGARQPLEWLHTAVRSSFAALGASDALYHNVEHTTHVVLVGLELLRNRQLRDGDIDPASWANVAVALLCHDIGYVRDLDCGDSDAQLTLNLEGRTLADVSGASDAVLMPVHVNRGKQYAEHQYMQDSIADIGLICACIERTRFPVPEEAWYEQTGDLPGLVRAADLIGQLSDPRYLQKLSAIFFEFEETGFNERTGYRAPRDLLLGYPAFFEHCVAPFIAPAESLLELSEEGQDILAHLYGNLESARAALREAGEDDGHAESARHDSVSSLQDAANG